MEHRMNPIVKSMWLRALRSGDYIPARGVFKSLNGHNDALGVLCELAVQNNIIPPAQLYYRVIGGNNVAQGYMYDGHATLLPDSVALWAGLEILNVNHIMKIDDSGTGWEQIIQYIEAYL